MVYQEPAIEVIAAVMGCDEGEADKFRKGLNRHAERDTLDKARDEFVAQARQRHPDLRPRAAFQIWEQIAGWGGYGFVQGHAGAFAATGYKSAYLSVHHPAQFFAGLLSHGPLGFYSANSYAAEARRRACRSSAWTSTRAMTSAVRRTTVRPYGLACGWWTA